MTSKLNLNQQDKGRGAKDFQLANIEEYVLGKVKLDNIFNIYSSDGILMDQVEFNRVLDNIIKPLKDLADHYKELSSVAYHVIEENEQYIADLERAYKEVTRSYMPEIPPDSVGGYPTI